MKHDENESTPSPQAQLAEGAAETLEQKNERNARVQARYDALMQEGRRGHYETLFRVVREEVGRALAQQVAPQAQQAQDDFPPLPERAPELDRLGKYYDLRVFTASQMRAYVLADRAARDAVIGRADGADELIKRLKE